MQRNSTLLCVPFFCFQLTLRSGYLFFGNAKKLSPYVHSMFEEVDVADLPQNIAQNLPPFPEVIVIDMALVTGMDVR